MGIKTFTIGTACGLATSGTGIPISLRYLSAGISSIAAIAMTTWTKLAVSQRKLLLTYLAAGIFCATTCQLSSTGVQAMRTSTAAANFGSMIMSLPFRSDDAAALVNALVTGDKSWLSPEIVGTFRTSGASHILALSGLHLGIIYIILGYATSILGRSPAAKTTRQRPTLHCIMGNLLTQVHRVQVQDLPLVRPPSQRTKVGCR